MCPQNIGRLEHYLSEKLIMVATTNQTSAKCHSNLLLSFLHISNTLIVNSTPTFLLSSLMRLHAKMRVFAVISYGSPPCLGSCRHLMFPHMYTLPHVYRLAL